MYTARPESWALDHIGLLSDSDSDLEFFDAAGRFHDTLALFNELLVYVYYGFGTCVCSGLVPRTA